MNLITRSPIYYGWCIVATLAIFNTLAGSVSGSRLGLFIKPMGDDLGIGAASFGWAQMGSLSAIMISGPIIGRLIDRFGARMLLPSAAFLGGIAVASLSLVSEPWQIICIFVVTGLLGFGHASELYANVVIAKWFVTRRGRAMGIGFALSTSGLVVFMPVTQWLIDNAGWATTWLFLGIGVPSLVIPLTALVLRRHPEDVGLLPDGVKPDLENDTAQERIVQEAEQRESWTRAEAIHTKIFWQMVIGFGLAAFSTSIQAVFRIPHFVERGVDAQIAALAVSGDAILAALVAAFISGRLLDYSAASGRFHPKYLAMAGFLILINGAIFTIIGDTVTELFIAFLSFGIAIAFIMVSQNVLWANTFGRVHLGSIRGLTIPMTMGISAIAFPMTGYIREITGEYTLAWWVSIVGLVVSLIVISQLKWLPKARDLDPKTLGGF